MKFLIVAHDGKGKKAAARRQAVRPVHLERMKGLIAKQRVEVGGGLLDETGNMIGSVMIVDFKNRRALDAYLAREPYVTEGVWKKITVTPMNRVI